MIADMDATSASSDPGAGAWPAWKAAASAVSAWSPARARSPAPSGRLRRHQGDAGVGLSADVGGVAADP